MQGSRFGKYRIDRMIATGGMAEVYRAFTSSGGAVAVKKILPEFSAQPKFIQMFIDEARIVIRLRHPNVVQLLDFGKIDTTYFLSMEWIDGKSLAEIVLQQRQSNVSFPIDVAVLMAIDVCEGLAYAHDRTDQYDRPLHIVHRDISPPNILVTREGVAKVADFGISDMRGKATLTKPGVIRGKFSYMSPEQSRGENLDHRSDIFAAGIVLYEMLMSVRLFLREKEVLTIDAVRKCQIPPMRSKRKDISPELEDVIRKALSPLAKDRYGTAKEFSDALQEMIAQEFPAAGRDNVIEFFKRLFPQERFYRSTSVPGIPRVNYERLTSPVIVPPATFLERTIDHPYLVSGSFGALSILLVEAWVRWGHRVLAIQR